MAEENVAVEGEELLRHGGEIQRVGIPSYYASSIQGAVAGNDFILTFLKPHPIVVSLKGEQSPGAALEPAFSLSVSPQTAKDLSLLMNDMVARYEKEFGQIQTEFTRARKK